MNKKIMSLILGVLCFVMLAGCQNTNVDDVNLVNQTPQDQKTDVAKSFDTSMFSVMGFAQGKVLSRDMESTDEGYLEVYDEEDFLYGLDLANKKEIKVMEIKVDLNLGWKQLNEIDQKNGKTIYSKIKDKTGKDDTITNPIILESGVSEIEISNVDGLTIFSKDAKTIKHAMFKVASSNDVVIRNLKFDGLWQWEDSKNINYQNIGDNDMKSWSYFKVNQSNNIWFDHLTFGKAYDTLIDSENGSSGITISWSRFLGGYENEFYTNQMESLEERYLNGTLDFVYYKYLRDSGLTAIDIFELFRAQKKGFMVGAGVEPYDSQWEENKQLEFTIANTYLKDLQDRLPRIRGGSAHVYNVYLDNNDIYSVINRVENYTLYKDLQNGIKANKWKFELTNQAMVTTNGAGVKYQNSIFEGVKDIIVNNNQSEDWLGNPTYYVNPLYTGSYMVEDCIFSIKDLIDYRGNSWDLESPFVSKRLTFLNFRWNTASRQLTYSPELIEMNTLKDILEAYSGAGVVNINWLQVNY